MAQENVRNRLVLPKLGENVYVIGHTVDAQRDAALRPNSAARYSHKRGRMDSSSQGSRFLVENTMW